MSAINHDLCVVKGFRRHDIFLSLALMFSPVKIVLVKWDCGSIYIILLSHLDAIYIDDYMLGLNSLWCKKLSR